MTFKVGGKRYRINKAKLADSFGWAVVVVLMAGVLLMPFMAWV